MKKICFAFLLFAMTNCFAQADGKITLKKDQKITVLMNSSMDADLGMGMQMKNASTITNVIHVIAEDDKNYTVTNTINKLNISMDVMGQSQSYDSEKEADKDSEMGKALSQKLNGSDTLFVEKTLGSVISKSNRKNASPEAATNPFEGMMEAMGSSGNENIVAEYAFLIIPAGKKIGDSWTDSSTDKNMRTVKTYTFKSLDKNIATIGLNTTVTGNTQTEMQGTSVDISMNTTSTGDIIVDSRTSQVSKRSIITDITGTIDMMGQSMPITAKNNSTFVYQ